MHDRINASSANRRPAADALANVALILNVSAFISFAICLGEIGIGSTATVISLASVAAVCFVASLVCFATDNAMKPPPTPVRLSL